MEEISQTAAGVGPAAERAEFCWLFNDQHIRLESTMKVRPAVPEPVFYGSLPKNDVPKWIAWNVGSWLETRGVKASVGVKKVVHGASGAYAIDIFINQKGCHEDYRIVVRPLTHSLELLILTCTTESKGQPAIISPIGELSMVRWSSSVNLDEPSTSSGGGGGGGQLRHR
jgi:hypothetical protein